MLDTAQAAATVTKTVLSETLTLSFAEDAEFDSFESPVGARLRSIFGHADCRFIVRLHAEYRGNQFVKIIIGTRTHGIRGNSFECFGTANDDRNLHGGPRLRIDDVNRAKDEATITITHRGR